MSLFHFCDSLLVGWIDLVVSVRADVDKALKEFAENCDLFLRHRAANAVIHASPFSSDFDFQ
jgi:hypothetical protein